MRLTLHTGFCFVWTVLLCLAGTAFSLPAPRATRTTVTTVSPNPSVVGQPVKVSFRVEAPGGSLAPSGNVMVMGAGQCQAPVEAGSCSLVISEAGSTTLTATYYGDRNFLPSTSTNVVTQEVTDFSLSTSSSPGSAEAEKSSYQLILTPRGGFTGRVSLACAGLPAGATCTFSPSTVTLNGQDHVGSIVTVQTSSSTPSVGTLSITGVSGGGDPASGGLTRRALIYVDVSAGPSDLSSRSSAGSGGSASGEVMQVVRDHPILVFVDLAAIVILGGFLLWFAGWAIHRELVRKERRPKPQIAFALWFFGIVLAGIMIGIALGPGEDVSKNQMGVVINGWLLFALGIALVFYGLSTYRLYRFHSDTAASTIRSMAMGFVEISGSAMPAGPPAPSPISATPCLAYQVDVEIATHVVGNVQEENWMEYFTDRPGGRFYLMDKTGRVLVDVRGAHFDFITCQCEINISPSGTPQSWRSRPWQGRPSEDALAAFVSREGNSESGDKKPFKSGHLFRLTERCIGPSGSYSVAGTCVENPAPKDELDRNLIVKGANEKTFEISRQREAELQSQLLNRGKRAIYGGAILAVISMALILIVLYG